MITPQTLGKRIKYFRKRAKFSQLDLELEAGLAPGAISRIEKGRVSTSRDTVMKIAKVTGMNNKEISYLIGSIAEPATEGEIAKAKGEVDEYFSGRNLAYLLDDRWRICDITDTFLKALRLDRNYMDNFSETVVLNL